MRLLVVNVFFEPLSFGGATVVAEQMAAALQVEHGFEVAAVSARFHPFATTSIVRHRSKYGFDAWSVGLKQTTSNDDPTRIANPEFDAAFEKILDYFKPDVVHVHCAQEIGVSFFDTLLDRRIPFAVTVHDFWWICERQFMITPGGAYCGQRVIDYAVCAQCSSSRAHTERRANYLKAQLAKSDLVLTPSEFARQMLIDNGFGPEQVRLNKNGVPPPGADYALRRENGGDGLVRVGFVGGPGAIKGWNLIVAALAETPHDRIRLVAFDAAARIGAPWRSDLERTSIGLPVEVAPPYTTDDIDRAFGQLDAVIMPSCWKETFGLTVREALIRGLWAIASDAGGLAEDIADGVNGRILPFPPTVADVQAALTELLAQNTKPPFKVRHVTTISEQAAELAATLTEVVRGRSFVDRLRHKEAT